MNEHPVRLVVTDDLRRSRLTVFFRLLLSIPHVLWLGLWGSVAFVVGFINWVATLFRGESPRGLHDFLAGYVRYATHVEAYLLLAANEFPGFFLGSVGPYAVDVEIAPPARQNRWVTGFRAILFVPAALILSAFFGGSGGGGRSGYSFAFGLVGTAAFLIWFAVMARGRAPRGLRDVIAWGLGYSAQASAYFFLLTDRYPHTSPSLHVEPVEGADPRPARLVVTDDLRRSRLTVFFRLLLAVPHLVWWLLWTIVAAVAALTNWFAALALGRSPRPLTRFLSAYIRYTAHLFAFLYLVGNPFPGFVGKAGSYPVDVELGPFGRQSRWVTLFRLVLAVPAGMVAGAAWSLALTAAFLGWFAALVRGRMPEGLRDAGAYALGYGAQYFAYAFVLTDRYPYSGPAVGAVGAQAGPPQLD